jgi:hypothetical protein
MLVVKTVSLFKKTILSKTKSDVRVNEITLILRDEDNWHTGQLSSFSPDVFEVEELDILSIVFSLP